MKKLLSILLCISILCTPAFAEYDFSDEAQREFDNRQYQQIQPNENFSKTRKRHEIKNNTPEEIFLEPNLDRTNYEPSPSIEQSFEKINPELIYGSVVKVPAGTTFNVTFNSGINSGSLEKNDRLTVQLTNNLVYNGSLIAPAGSLVYGSATDTKNAGYAYGSGAMEFTFNQILLPDGNIINIATEPIILKAKSERTAKMTRDVVIGALGSLLVGAAFTALGGGTDDWGKRMLIYGGVGALGGGVHGALQRGNDVDIPDGTTVQLKLIDTLTASPYFQ